MEETSNKIQSIKSQKDKNGFILKLLDYAINKKLDSSVSNKILKLAQDEIGKENDINKEILVRLGKVEEILNGENFKLQDKVSLVMENEEEYGNEKNTDQQKSGIIPIHNPIHTTEILKRFKYKNDSGFKELVHSPTDIEGFTKDEYVKVLNKSRDSFKKLSNVPYLVYLNIKELISLMMNEGEEIVEKTQKHPYLNAFEKKIELSKYGNLSKVLPNKTITNLIQGFKKNYRFGFEKTESSILRDLIINVFNKVSENTNIAKENHDSDKEFSFATNPSSNSIVIDINFSESFDDLSTFFTWVPNVKNILYIVAEDILKHGNLNGKENFKSKSKTIEFCIEKEYDETLNCTKILLSILDEKSICKKNPELLFKEMNDKLSQFTKGICDWSIDADFNSGPYRLQFLPELSVDLSISKLKESSHGFKYIFTFYD